METKMVSQLAAVVLLGAIAASIIQRFKKSAFRLPPGPQPYPIIGNLFDLPPKGMPEYQHWFKHKDTFGPVSSVSVMGKTMIIFHDKNAANAIMGKKAQKTSARPQLNFAQLCGFENFLITHQYDDKYRKHRKMVHQEIGTTRLSAAFQPIQEKEALRYILRTFNDPDNMMVYLKTLAAAIVLKITYGYQIESGGDDPLINLIEHAMDNLSSAFVPLKWAVDAIPALKYLPDWFPGMSYRKLAKEWKEINESAAEIPYAFVKRQFANNTHRPSYVSSLLQQKSAGDETKVGDLSPDDEEAIKWTAVSLYAAGSDSTVAIMESVILAMLLYPEVMTKAQEEIDRVVGTERLPTFDDRASLPFVNAIVKEAWRWNPVGPMGLTHKSEEDLWWDGYLIPAGSYLLPSLWWFLHDPNVYPDPDDFKPERYLEPLNEPDPSEVAFGYGRRSCSGRYFADASIYITVAKLLACFVLSKAKDPNTGKEIPVKLESVAGMINRPKPYRFNINPRSLHHEDLLRRIEAAEESTVGDSRFLNINL